MRMRRIKVPAAERAAVYHCVTRTVNGEFLFDEQAKEILRKHLRQAERFCGVEILTFCILDNHFHVLVKVPQLPGNISDRELLARYSALYPKPTKFQQASLAVIAERLQSGSPEAEALRAQLLSRMNDVSEFMKIVKQRFTVWFNRSHNRYGTLWAERFKSVLVENTPKALQTVAAYIDLNPVRAGLVDDPADYRWCGFAEAMAGVSEAREGLASAVFAQEYGLDSWRKVIVRYRALLGAEGSTLRPGQERKVRMDRAAAVQMMESGQQLPLSDALRCRVRYFTDGALLGSKEFISGWLSAHKDRLRPRLSTHSKPLRGADWGDLVVYRGLRRRVFG
ncbi:MAG: transposase [Bdellovibrionaceae bacterium]|nr:transposase [Pseudobdellovibrionaceae bacterium]